MSDPTTSRVHISSAASIVAALPAMIGFTPHNSIVVILLATDTARKALVRAVIRSDSAGGQTSAADIAAAASRQHADSAIVIAVAEPSATVQALDGVDAISQHLTQVGIDVHAALHTFEVIAGALFSDLGTGHVGTIPDPTTSEVAAAQVLSGRVIESTRDALVHRFAEGTEIPESVGLQAAARLGDDFLAATFEELAATVYAREIPSDDVSARVGITLSGSPLDVRAAYLRLAVYGEESALDVMTHVARGLRGTARGQALTIAGYFAYLGGDGASAGIAFDAAQDAAEKAGETAPSFTVLLDRALRAGFEPDGLRELIPDADVVEESTGARLPG
ncbi:DUF4192 domain-containing protein [Rhodococcus sp. PAMC28707]|uniref:DUF4192 domain-containing protein n=1 Tax=unclassified Rhodococcus (in: high G+C Gram-positive bacteria) TaxID=192944 RepID=UPI00109E2408|nr:MULTISPECIES: DUF4192 domain-containing protein [unclassified Rhodococcus (in: high G+C Gram-positive bacteria)]QCB51818.1 DUF4192 domain-containing protein [Rhodococcus sp. PAMC28705]QCB60013.1 DUF4192 domain-containing protein [Rhodococcus sp. PAMC28707]